MKLNIRIKLGHLNGYYISFRSIEDNWMECHFYTHQPHYHRSAIGGHRKCLVNTLLRRIRRYCL